MTTQTEALRLARDALEKFARADRALGDEPGPFRFATGNGHRLIERDDFRAATKALAAIDKELAANVPEIGKPCACDPDERIGISDGSSVHSYRCNRCGHQWPRHATVRGNSRYRIEELKAGAHGIKPPSHHLPSGTFVDWSDAERVLAPEKERPQPVGPDQHADMIIELRLAWDEMEQLAPKPIPTIVAAALRCEDGVVYCLDAPARHHDVIQRVASTGAITAVIASCKQGFLTSDGLFVDRREAKRIAFAAGQMKRETHPTELFSEDVW
jgi:hypothetical protein